VEGDCLIDDGFRVDSQEHRTQLRSVDLRSGRAHIRRGAFEWRREHRTAADILIVRDKSNPGGSRWVAFDLELNELWSLPLRTPEQKLRTLAICGEQGDREHRKARGGLCAHDWRAALAPRSWTKGSLW
jgi:hypothetical protein